MKRWWRRRQFFRAYRILRNESERHIKAGHVRVNFYAVNPSWIGLHCPECKDAWL